MVDYNYYYKLSLRDYFFQTEMSNDRQSVRNTSPSL